MRIFTDEAYIAENTIKITKSTKGNDVSLFGAFRRNEDVTLSVSVDPRSGAYGFCAVICDDDTQEISHVPFYYEYTNNAYDTYAVKLPTGKEALYFYKISYRNMTGEHFVKNELDDSDTFQLTVYDERYEPPKWLHGGIIYHIFVDRFAKSGKCTPKD